MQMSAGTGPRVLALWSLCALWIFAADAGNLSRRSARRPATDRGASETTSGDPRRRWSPRVSSVPATCRDWKDEAGRCAHLGDCIAEEYDSNLTLAMEHACPILRTYVGICCEDRRGGAREKPVEERRLADLLPLIAAADDDGWRKEEGVEEEKGSTDGARIVWSERPSTSRPRDPERPRGCGTTWRSRSKLAGGRPADPTEWPWMAALLGKDRSQYCGGVLVTDRHVLTAAHCVYSFKPRDVSVRLGEYDFASAEESRALDFAVSEIRVHPDFDIGSYENDVALVKMHRPTVFDSYVWPVCLPPMGQTFENKRAIVTGWGTSYYGGPTSTVLMEVEVPVWPQDKCAKSFVQRIPSTAMCAGGYEGGRDACQGDSGGPLLHQLANGRWVSIGIVSWGIRCGDPQKPGVYTRVSSYLEWIFRNAVF